MPLAVDLDGTLIHGDIFTAWMLRLARHEPQLLPRLLFWLLQGRAYAKMQLARRYGVNAALLPYNDAFLAWLRLQHASGRTLALATACDKIAADAVAQHLGLFSRIIASEGRANIKSRKKAAALSAAYPAGFVYAGNERADLRIWRVAQAAILVDVSVSLTQHAKRSFAVEAEFPRGPVNRAQIAKALASALAPPAQTRGAR